MRLVIDVQETDGALLVSMSWLTLDNNLSAYFQNAGDGTTYTLEPKPTSAMPQNGWYYQALAATTRSARSGNRPR
jgi:hypothetical protein